MGAIARRTSGQVVHAAASESARGPGLTVREASLPKPRLLGRVCAAVRARHCSRRTEKAYVHWIKRYIFLHAKRQPAELGAAEVTAFLAALAVHGKASVVISRAGDIGPAADAQVIPCRASPCITNREPRRLLQRCGNWALSDPGRGPSPCYTERRSRIAQFKRDRVTPPNLECPAGEEEVHETHARHRHSLRRARRTSGG
jgi:Phage integrase, N-terminal SAM-like domain